ncbi:MAG: Kelch repeat-containing protein [Planctomycetota bacterium]
MRTFLCCSLLLLSACSGGNGGAPIVPAGLSILPNTLLPGAPGSFYSVTLRGAGGTGAGYEWRLVSGPLPPGLTGLPATGRNATLQGTLGAAGTYDFTVELRDSAAAETTILYSLVVTPGGPGPGPGNTSLVNAPSPRGYHTAVWTGSEMIVWGGLDYLGTKNSGGAYNPATDTWRTPSTAGAPAARLGHTAVWTGTEMIVWGGSDLQGALGTGGAYDPATDGWRALSTSGAPERRTAHSATWTGAEMIIWGGQGVFALLPPNAVDKVLADGSAYDPVADSWTPISFTGSPPAARGHTVVWTGSRMIVWGGRDGIALTISTVNSGGAYDAVADAWTATNVATAPAARAWHTAVWDGSRMIVWGGRTSMAPPVQSGGRYALAGDSWAATTTAGAPSGRTDHTAVWTGLEMIVWGGSGAAGQLGDGAAYEPMGNSWRALPASFLPTPRSGHTAVWTGTVMIVWGGATSPADTYLNTGAILTP